MKRCVLLVLCFACGASGQTQVSLRDQAKNVDFSGATSTKPARTGSALPATCGTGEVFFLLNQNNSSSLYGCTATNTWAPLGGGAATIKWQNAGVTAGTESTVDFSAGDGILTAVTDTGNAIAIQQSADTSVLLTNAAYQAAAPILCASASNSSTRYTCGLSPELQSYSTPMLILWMPDVPNAASPTLNIDTLGSVLVTASDATTLQASAVAGGHLYPIWYDGTEFRLLIPASGGSGSYSISQSSFVVGCAAYAATPVWWIASDANMGPGCYANGGSIYGWEGVGPVSSLNSNDLMAWSVVVPHAWVSGSVSIVAYYGDSGASGTYQFAVSGSCGTANSAQNLPAITGSGNYAMQKVSLSGLNMSGCSPDSMLTLKFTRVDSTNASTRFYGASITYSIP